MSTAKKILVVEDEAVTALDICDIVETLGYAVVGHAVSGSSAIDLAKSNQPDLVLMDIKIKGDMDGITTAGHIWDSLKIPVVFLTAFSDEDILARAQVVQPYGYVLKPFDKDDLRATIQLALHRANQEGVKTKPKEVHTKDVAEVDFAKQKLSSVDFLRRIDPFRNLEEKVLTQFAAACQFAHVDAGTQLMHEGATKSESFIVATGRIALVKASSTGKELTVDLLPPGDVYTLLLAHEAEVCEYSAIAQVKSSVLHIPDTSLELLLEEHPWMFKEFAELLTERVRRSHNFSQKLAHERVEVRIAWALLCLLTDFAKKDSASQEFQIQMTRQQLAELTGTTPETAIRATKKMEREGMLNLETPGTIRVLDTEALEQLSEV